MISNYSDTLGYLNKCTRKELFTDLKLHSLSLSLIFIVLLKVMFNDGGTKLAEDVKWCF